ncbi:30S ribosomal protein S8e [Candidatus Woesearchaeota archaeon]|nr:MAG: 30S ribosomal protein S8e [Candidatus Woesearchaeota archaeon]
MVVIQHGKRNRKPTGGRYKQVAGKRKHAIGRLPTSTKVAEGTKIKTVRTKGGSRKARVLTASIANVYDPKNKKFLKSKVKRVEEVQANRHFVRRNIIVKGAIIETEAGRAKVTSRPGQDGTVNAVLL